MRFLTKVAAAILSASLGVMTAGSAGAVIVAISAPSPDPTAAGVDPLGDAFSTNVGGLTWNMGQEAFNPGGLTTGDGSSRATLFRFTINNGLINGIEIDPTKTFFEDVTTGQTWSAAFFSAGPTPNQRVEFTAPGASFISALDQFRIKITFVTPLSAPRYSWSANWDNTLSSTTPEPATWALMISGFGLAGMALRRRRAAAA